VEACHPCGASLIAMDPCEQSGQKMRKQPAA
jgi:hypothetical protein